MAFRPTWRRASRGAWGAACALVLVYALHVASGSKLGLAEVAWTTWVPVSCLGLCAAAALLSAAAADPASRLMRVLLGLGIACYAPGTALYTQIVASQKSADFPTYADFCWIAFYPLAFAAVVVIFRRSVTHGRPVALFDAGVGALTVLAAGSLLLLSPVLRGGGLDGDSVGSMGYSIGDQLLVGAAIGTFAAYGWRPPRALVVLTVGLLLQAVEDGIYLRYLVRDVFPADGWLIVFWLANFSIISAAAVFPRLRTDRQVEHKLGPAAMATFGFALALVLVTIVVMSDPHPWAVVIVLDGAALLLVVGRMGLALRGNLRLLEQARDDSRTDPLTRLGNRRDLHEMVGRELNAPVSQRTKLTLAIYDLDGFKGYNDSYGHPAGDALLRRLSMRLRASVPPPGRAFRLGGDEFCVLIPERAGDAEAVISACRDALTESGELFYVTSSYGTAIMPTEGATLSEALAQADRRLYAMKVNRPMRAYTNAVGLLRRVQEEAEPDLRAHHAGVARLAVETGTVLGLAESQLVILSHAAEFHDLGKIAIPDSILNKPGPLDADEWAYVHRHTVIGERFLSAVPGMEYVARIVRASHERVDGHGYPDGLRGDEIPLEARIVAVCDAFDAMTSDRPYSHSRSAQAALAELRRCAGTQFDPQAVAALESVVDHVPAAVPLGQPA